MELPAGVSTGTYTYAGTGYANPHAVTQIANGVSTTTFVYDADGNVTQKTTDGTSTTYVWDYANRLIALGSGGATTTLVTIGPEIVCFRRVLRRRSFIPQNFRGRDASFLAPP